MKGIMNDNQLTIVKKYEIIKPLIHKIDSLFDNCYSDCHNAYFHTFRYGCIYYINFTNIGNNEVIILTIFDRTMGLTKVLYLIKYKI